MAALKRSVCTDCLKSDVCMFKVTVQTAEVLQNDLYHNITVSDETNRSVVGGRLAYKASYDLQNRGISFNTECSKKKTEDGIKYE